MDTATHAATLQLSPNQVPQCPFCRLLANEQVLTQQVGKTEDSLRHVFREGLQGKTHVA